MLRYVNNVDDWEQVVFREPGPGPGIENQHLDLKQRVTDNADDIALPVGAFANTEGGVIAYGAHEANVNGAKMATMTFDLGRDTQGIARRLETIMRQYLWGIELPKPWVSPIQLRNGHNVIALNVPPSIGLVACGLPAERGKIRFPIRIGEATDYLKPDEVEQRMQSYADRATRLRLEAFLGAPPVSVQLVHVPNGAPEDFPFVGSVERLDTHGLLIRFWRESPAHCGRHQTHPAQATAEIPYDWVRSLWSHHGNDFHSPRARKMLLAAALDWPPSSPADDFPPIFAYPRFWA